MTVASLWKALDRAGCGKQVGVKEIKDHHCTHTKANPWNIREIDKISRSQENQPVLAVDLSIWICEALASSAMKQNYVVDPPLQLVYSRVLKLLSNGIKLVVVVEGKRRSQEKKATVDTTRPNQDDSESENEAKPRQNKFRKRRSGTRFIEACQRCEIMLNLLGVIVVRANAEGEALCALLNQKGIVDGVISNDGDCLLFGAKVLYTKFSVENLDNGKVIRYDADKIRVVVDDDDADKYDETGMKSKHGQDIIEMSRNDLVAFSILTGSDLAGNGISKVGCRKAIRFIRKCQIDNPLKLDDSSSPALKLLISWGRSASSSINSNLQKDTTGPICGCCGHLGTKKDHKKYGCVGCGTEPGELCFPISPGGRFLKQLRSKVLNMRSDFNPSLTLKAYYEPNENQIPLRLVGKTARTLKMNLPQLEKILQLPFIIRGRTIHESRDSVRKSLSSYLARQELFELLNKPAKENQLTKLPMNNNRPSPLSVNKLLIRNGQPSCEVKWLIKATTSDAEGNPMDEYEFSTIEDESVIKKCYPKLLSVFHEEQRKKKQQGAAEQEKRRSFLLDMEKPKEQGVGNLACGTKKIQKRKDHFDQAECINKPLTKLIGVSDDVKAILLREKEKKNEKTENVEENKSDVLIGRVISTKSDTLLEKNVKQQAHQNDGDEANFCEPYERQDKDDSSTIATFGYEAVDKNSGHPYLQEVYFRDTLVPGHTYYLGIESAFQFRDMAGGDFHLETIHTRKNSGRDESVVSVEKEPLDGFHANSAERKEQSERNDLEIVHSKNQGPLSEYERLKYLRNIPYSHKSGSEGVLENFKTIERHPNSFNGIEQRRFLHIPLHEGCKNESSEIGCHSISNVFQNSQSGVVGKESRARFFVPKLEFSEKTRYVKMNTKNLNDCDPPPKKNLEKLVSHDYEFPSSDFLYDPCGDGIDLINERDSTEIMLEPNGKFDSDQCQILNCCDYDEFGHMNGLEYDINKSDDIAHDMYERFGSGKRKRGQHRQVEGDRRREIKHDRSEIDTNHFSSVMCCGLCQREGMHSWSNYKCDTIYGKRKIPEPQILQDQSNYKNQENRRYNNKSIQGGDGLCDGNKCRSCGRKYELENNWHSFDKPTVFESFHPVKPTCNLDPQNSTQDSYHFKMKKRGRLVFEMHDCQNQLSYDETCNKENCREFIDSRDDVQDLVWGTVRCEYEREENQVEQKDIDILNPNLESRVREKNDELEKRVFIKFETQKRRARINRLCSKYI